MRVYVGLRDPYTGRCRVGIVHEVPRPSLTEVCDVIADLRRVAEAPWMSDDPADHQLRAEVLTRKESLIARLEEAERAPPPVELSAVIDDADGYAWGGEPGSSNLAFAILRAELGEDPPVELYRRFRHDVIDLVHERYEFRLPADAVWSWIEANRELVEAELFEKAATDVADDDDWDLPAPAIQPDDAVAGEDPDLPDAAASRVVQACEEAWAEIRRHHSELPEAVMVLGSGVERGRLVKLGHWWAGRWVADGQPRGEVLLAGEALHLPPEEVFEVLLHEAAHGLNAARKIKDTSRGGRYHNARFAAAAAEVGLSASPMPPYGLARTALTPEARERYGAAIERLGGVMRIARQLERDVRVGQSAGEEAGDETGNGRAKGRALAECGCGRKLRVARGVLAAGPITCGLCEREFVTDRAASRDEASSVVDRTFLDRRQRAIAAADGRTDPGGTESTQRRARLEQLVPGEAADLVAASSWYERFGTHEEVPMTAHDQAAAARRTELARALLRADGTLRGPDVEVAGLKLAAGDRVVAVAGDAATGLPVGTLGTVEHVDASGPAVEIDFATWGRLRAGVEDAVAKFLRHDYVEAPAVFLADAGPEPIELGVEPAVGHEAEP